MFLCKFFNAEFSFEIFFNVYYRQTSHVNWKNFCSIFCQCHQNQYLRKPRLNHKQAKMSNTIQQMRYCYGNRLEMDPWRSPDKTFDQSEKLPKCSVWELKPSNWSFLRTSLNKNLNESVSWSTISKAIRRSIIEIIMRISLWKPLKCSFLYPVSIFPNWSKSLNITLIRYCQNISVYLENRLARSIGH